MSKQTHWFHRLARAMAGRKAKHRGARTRIPSTRASSADFSSRSSRSSTPNHSSTFSNADVNDSTTLTALHHTPASWPASSSLVSPRALSDTEVGLSSESVAAALAPSSQLGPGAQGPFKKLLKTWGDQSWCPAPLRPAKISKNLLCSMNKISQKWTQIGRPLCEL